MTLRPFLFVFVTLAFLLKSFGQDTSTMEIWQDSLLKLSALEQRYYSDPERIERNSNFVKTLVSSLKETNAFYFNFEKLTTISILNAPDDSFRIFSWYIPLSDGSFLYYGAIQFASSELILTPLLDKTFEIKKPITEVLSSSRWYGARYYDIIGLGSNRYILLGWKGHHRKYSQKVIEILSINPNEILFGANVFSDNQDIVRRIFSYTRQANMFLQYDRLNKRIVFDHLVSLDPDFENDFKYLVPDLSYDGYIIENSKLKFLDNIDVKNVTVDQDNKYIDPLKPSKHKSGIR